MPRRKISPAWLAGTKIPSVEYAALLSDVPREELQLFAAMICEQVIEFRVVEGHMENPPRITTEMLTEPLLLKALSGLHKAIYGKQASKNARPGEIRLKSAWHEMKVLHSQHRGEFEKRSTFVRFAVKSVSDCPSHRQATEWVKKMDEQQTG